MSTSSGVRPGFLDQREIMRRTGANRDQLKYIRRQHLKEEADWYRRERTGLPAREPLICYRLAPVQKALKKVGGDYGAKMRAWWQDRKRDDERVTVSVAAEIVGVSQITIRMWSDEGFPYLEGNPRPDVQVQQGPGDLEYQTWLRSEMEEWKRVLLRIPREPNGEDIYTPETTAELMRIPINVLRHKERRPARLVAVYRPVMKSRQQKFGNRPPVRVEQVHYCLAFKKAPVNAWVQEFGAPAGRMSTTEAAGALGVNCLRVTRFLKAGLLRGVRVRQHRRGEVRPWSIETESVRDLQKAIGAIGGLRRRPGLWEALRKEVERIRAERAAVGTGNGQAAPTKKQRARPRLRFDQQTHSVWLDEVLVCSEIPPKPFRFFERIAKANGDVVTGDVLRTLPGLAAARLFRIYEQLPVPVRLWVKSTTGPGGGYWLELPAKRCA